MPEKIPEPVRDNRLSRLLSPHTLELLEGKGLDLLQMEQSQIEDYLKEKLRSVPLESFLRNLPVEDLIENEP